MPWLVMLWSVLLLVTSLNVSRNASKTKRAKSFNIHPGADDTKRICELNNKTKQMKPADLKKKKGSIDYGSVKVS